ncbi:MAG: hypothetical protein L5655_03215 [Thermosediminibacteraceae bacterium]|nr:hypothetical protein [Thermosediminibacteraceae bacterium]
MNKVLIYLDEEDFKGSLSLLGVPEKIYRDGRYETYGLCINGEYEEAYTRFDYLINVSD